jgi:hypothetical protein
MSVVILHKVAARAAPCRDGLASRKAPSVVANEHMATGSLHCVWTSTRTGIRCRWEKALRHARDDSEGFEGSEESEDAPRCRRVGARR